MPEVRPDRLATLYFFQPLRKLVGRQAADLPILMYHSISDTPEPRRAAYFQTCTAPPVFRRQMEFLFRNGYKVVGLRQAALDFISGTHHKTVVLTFDDGYQDFYTNAFPILTLFGYPATVFLPTAYITHNRRALHGKSCLTWNEVRELRKAGVEFGSHTATHPQLHETNSSQLRFEVTRSRDDIQEKLGERIETFAYPYAFPEADHPFVQHLRHVLLENGYRTGVTTIIGRAGGQLDPLFLSRLPINIQDDERLFEAKLEGDYDWLGVCQYLSKVKKSQFRMLARQTP